METNMKVKVKRTKKIAHSNSLTIGKATPYYYVSPAILIIALIVFYPLLYGFWLSTSNMSLTTFLNPKFIGFKNYLKLFSDDELISTLTRTIVWTFVNVFFHVSMGLFMALLLNRKLPGRALFRLLLIIPWAIPQYIAVLTWKGMFNLQFGLINILLGKIGVAPINWLLDPSTLFIGAIITNIWLGFPFMMMISLGGLQSIPNELYEAADIDGATDFQRIKDITLPLLKPVLAPAIVLGTVWTFNMVNVLIILSDGFGNTKSQILVTKVYQLAFNFYNYGYAAAYSVVIFLILLIFSIIYMSRIKGTEEAR